ncbi:hypothetical protein ACGFX4_31470 [Kitasatospora sp. NPDC048365]|uniref:hypothetical protein n=1 Tax=Kitasatospora sp. NPDC048365 TaxID=3364050 RepID=UPI00371B1E02
MPTHTANGDTRLSRWQRVRLYAVPPTMIETATARRRAGDWAGACAAAHVDVDLDLRSVARTHGEALKARLRADLRRLAPDLLRWHLPRIAPRGLLRPGLTVPLARYGPADHGGPGPLHLVVRTDPGWADAGQRISLALWDGSRTQAVERRHPHPRPSRRYRLDLHRHLWDADRSGELRTRSEAEGRPGATGPALAVPDGCAVGRWAAEAAILLHAEGRPPGPVAVRLGAGRRLLLDTDTAGRPVLQASDGDTGSLPVLPDAATWLPPDLELLRAGLIEPDRLHPLVAAALTPGHVPAASGPPTDPVGGARLVDCRGARHRIDLVDGVLAALDHDPAELRREELLAALTGTPLPCLQAIDAVHRHPEDLDDVRARLEHGDPEGALAVVERLLGPGAALRDGPLRDELAAAVERRVTHGLYRAGLVKTPPSPDRTPRRPRAL